MPAALGELRRLPAEDQTEGSHVPRPVTKLDGHPLLKQQVIRERSSWHDGFRHRLVNQTILGPGSFREGWQNEAASRVERQFGCETLSRRMSDPTELSSGRRLGPELACLCPAITHHFARIEPVSFAWSSCDVSTCPFASSLRTCFF